MSEMQKQLKALKTLLSQLEASQARIMSDTKLSDKRKSEAKSYFDHAINKCKDDIAYLEYWSE